MTNKEHADHIRKLVEELNKATHDAAESGLIIKASIMKRNDISLIEPTIHLCYEILKPL